jgi:dTDP-4-dehydrorhamnose 3,5-epimerase
MKFRETELEGAYVVDLERREDSRGFFARSWCSEEFERQGLVGRMVQANVSYNRKRGTLRGMHYQVAPRAETKLVRCTRGSIYDVIIDLRPDSRTRNRWIGVELRADEYRMLYVPEGVAHGFQVLEDDTEVTYQVSNPYTPAAERGIRWNDPAFGIRWPLAVDIISDKDASWPDFSSARLSEAEA